VKKFFEEDGSSTTFQDLLFLCLLGFLCILLIVLPLLNPPKPEDPSPKPPGQIIVEIVWDSDQDADVDLWVKGPEDAAPVGFTNRNDRQFSLLRDDLGNVNDVSNINAEFAFSRVRAPGQYVVNVHLYSSRNAQLPLRVSFVVRMNIENKTILIAQGVLYFTFSGEEQTAVQFELDADGNLVAGSIKQDFRPMRGL
jgi:hypothetical protein